MYVCGKVTAWLKLKQSMSTEELLGGLENERDSFFFFLNLALTIHNDLAHVVAVFE